MKKLPVYFFGERPTWQQKLKLRIKKAGHYAAVGFIIGCAVYIAGIVGIALFPQTIVAQVEVDTSLQDKIGELKDNLLSDLKKCESNGYTEDDAVIIFDSNKKASIGKLQWQIASVQHYYKTLYQRDITRKEAVEIALDEDLATTLAGDVIFTTPKGLTNWIICTKSKGLDSQLSVIKKLAN